MLLEVVDRTYIIMALERWGNACSIALLDPECLIFKVAAIDGVIGYRNIGNCIVVFGDPVCPSDQLSLLMDAFSAYCAAKSSNVVYVGASDVFCTRAIDGRYAQAAVQFAHEIVLNPMIDPTGYKGKKASLLRNKYNQSVRNGIQVHEYLEYDAALEQNLEFLAAAWSESKKGPQIYLYSGTLFTDRANKRWMYATQDNRVIGLAVLNRIAGQAGWVLNIMIVQPDALSCTSEFMVLRILELLRAEQCSFFSIGPSPAEQLVKIDGFDKLTGLFARTVYYILGNKFFRLCKRQRYWDKFYPEKKSSSLLFAKARIGVPELRGIMRAFNMHV